MLSQIPEVVECRHVTGEDCYVLTVWARSMTDLERVCTHLATAGHTTTSLIFSTRIHDRIPLVPRWARSWPPDVDHNIDKVYFYVQTFRINARRPALELIARRHLPLKGRA